MSETLPPVQPTGGGEPEPGPASSPAPTLSDNPFIGLAILIGALAALAWWDIWSFAVVMALVVSIFLHELGHYLVAKRNGMKVTEFFLGFGPRIWSFRRGETEYGIKLLWLGAYVKIIGMSNLEEVAPADESRSYRSQSFGRRVTAVLAGPAMNLGLGLVLLFVVTAGFGRPSDDNWAVRDVTSGSAAEQAGLQPDDRILAIDGVDVGDFSEFANDVRGRAGESVLVTVDRDGEELTLPLTVGWALTESSAAALGLRQGDVVTAVDGRPVTSYDEVVAAVQGAEGSVLLTFEDGTGPQDVTLVEAGSLQSDDQQGLLGVRGRSTIEHVGPVAAAGDAASQFGEIVVGSVQGMGRLFSPAGIGNLFEQVRTANEPDEPDTTRGVTVPADGSADGAASSNSDADRPLSILGIVNLGGEIGDNAGWAGILGLLAIVNIFLGLINLVPLLPLDGGHIAVACYEGIRSRIAHRPYRADMAKLMPVTYVVVLLMMGLALSTLYLDAVDPISIN